MYCDEPHKRNALRQAGTLYRMIDGELYRRGTEKEYTRYGLRMVIHDDQPQEKAEIIKKCHMDSLGNHLGMNGTLRNVTETYYWQGISSHVKLYMKECEICKTRSRMTAEEWMENERQIQIKKKTETGISREAKEQIKTLGRIKKSAPPETFFIVNAEEKISGKIEDSADASMVIDSNNIEYVVETLGHTEDGIDLPEICHVMNVPDIVPTSDRHRSREIENFLKYGTFPPDFTANQKNGLKNPASQYAIIDDELYHEANKNGSKGMRKVIHDDTPALKVKIMVENHMDEEGSHFGLNKTIRKISEQYYWAGLSVDVRRFMMHCQMCNSNRSKKSVVQDNHELSSQYQNQIHILKAKHNEKMAVSEEHIVGGTETEVEEVHAIQLDDNEGTVQEVQAVDYADGTEESGDTYNHVIKLMGPNQEVTEITVAVRKPKNDESSTSNNIVVQAPREIQEEQIEYVQAENEEQQIQEQQEAVNIIKEGDVPEDQTTAQSPQEMDNSAVVSDQEISAENATGSVQKTSDAVIEIQPLEGKTSVAQQTTEEAVQVQEELVVERTEDYPGSDDELVQVVVINEDGQEEHKVFRKDEIQAVTDLVNAAEETEAQELKEHTETEDSNVVQIQMPSSHSGQFYYYKDIIYCPKAIKTKAIESFLKQGHTRGHYSFPKLAEVAANYQIVDDVLCRRHTRYKNGHIVVHDDNPEVRVLQALAHLN